MRKAVWRERWQRRREDCAALSVIVVFFILFFYPVFFGGKFFVINDAFVYSYPLRMTAWAAIREGTWPLWTPLIMSGYPLLSMSHLGLAYPLTWGYLFLPGHWAEQIYILAPYLLAPMFVYAYARELGRSRMASVLAGLTFGYGGLMVSAVANNGLLPNALMWLPLVLIALERARKRPFIPCLLGATCAYGMCVLSGVGQGFVYVGAVMVAYAAFLALAANSMADDESDRAHNWTTWRRWRPLFVALCASLLAAGLAAFQILETMRAARRSVRSVLTYEIFTESSYTFLLTLKTLFVPLHYIIHATAYVSPLALVLAVLGIVAAFRSARRDVRVLFWAGVGVAAWVLMMGANTPLYRLLYHVPIINSFRAPPRHAFEWSFAIGILAAYGWDAAEPFFSREGSTLSRLPFRKIVAALLLLTTGVVVLVFWLKAANRVPAVWDESNHYPEFFPESRYLLWKLLFTSLTFAAVWLGWKILAPRWRVALLAAAVALSCFAEPAIMASRWWWPALKRAERFTTASPATRFMQAQAPDENRIYTRTALWLEEMSGQPRIDAPNLTMLHGLRNTAGYEPLILERYSRALGNVSMDAANPRAGFKPDRSLFEPRSHVLDLLNTTFVASYLDLLTEPTPPLEKGGIRFQALDLLREVKPGETAEVEGVAHESDALGVVSSLGYSALEPDGTVVAKLRLHTADNRVIERELRAGVDTAEWAYERPDVKTNIRHALAPIFDSFPGDESNSFTFHRYWARIPLDERVRVNRIEITNTSPRVVVGLWKMTLYDSATQFSMPLPHYDLDRWEPAFEHDGVEIIRNKRVLPRVWLVGEAEAVDGEEALRRIRGESERTFDPRRTALLEMSPSDLPRLPGGPLSTEANARLVSAEPNRLVVETNAATPSLLVVSEVNYPGWAATVDGSVAQIHTADYLLRGVALPSGTHRVEMRYKAPAARTGAILSLLTLLIIGGLTGYQYGKQNGRLRGSVSWLLQESRRIVARARMFVGVRGAGLLFAVAFTALMVYYCIFPLGAIWSTNGIVEPDCGQWMWNLWATNEAVTSGHNPYATNLLYYPTGVHNLSHQAIAAGFFPVTFLVKTLTGGAVLYPLYTYRLLIWLCLSLLLYSSYRLLRELGFTWWAAAAAAVAFSFSDFFMEHIAHLNILAGFFIPLSALCLLRWYREPESTAGAIKVAVVLAAAVYFTETILFIFLGAFCFLLFLLTFTEERAALLRKLKRAGTRRLLTAAAIFLLLVAPYLTLLITDDFIKPPPGENSTYSANLAGFFIPHPQRTPLYGPLFSSLVHSIKTGIGGYEVFTSFLLLSFGIIGVLKAKRRTVKVAALTALVFYVLSLGPTLKIFGSDTGIPLPYALLMRLPPFDWGRTPSRFVIIGMFFLMIAAAGGLTWLDRTAINRWGRRGSLIVMPLLLLWSIAEAYSPTPRQQTIVAPQNLAQRVNGPVLNLPLNETDGYAMFLQLFHRQPIATGYLPRNSAERQQHFSQLRRLFDKGGAALCESAARTGIKTIIIAPAAYTARVAPDMGPLDLGQCALDIVDLRGEGDDTALQPPKFPLFVVGTTLNFNTTDADSFLWYGWSGIEPFSRWSNKGRAAVVFSLRDVGDRSLSFKLSPFLAAGRLDAQRVRVQVNGHLIAELTLTDPAPKAYSVRVAGAQLRENNVLTFDLPDAESPLELGTGDDARLLGINVQWIKLDAAEAAR